MSPPPPRAALTLTVTMLGCCALRMVLISLSDVIGKPSFSFSIFSRFRATISSEENSYRHSPRNRDAPSPRLVGTHKALGSHRRHTLRYGSSRKSLTGLRKKHEAPFQVSCVPTFPCCHHGHTRQTSKLPHKNSHQELRASEPGVSMGREADSAVSAITPGPSPASLLPPSPRPAASTLPCWAMTPVVTTTRVSRSS